MKGCVYFTYLDIHLFKHDVTQSEIMSNPVVKPSFLRSGKYKVAPSTA
jgi:hypothetical protein